MAARLYTFIAEFRGTTTIAQVTASDEREAVLVWAQSLEAEKPFGRASSYLARSAARGDTSFEPVGISGITSVWSVTGLCGGDLLLADIVETVLPSNVRQRPRADADVRA
jgi:hypothetical protein